MWARKSDATSEPEAQHLGVKTAGVRHRRADERRVDSNDITDKLALEFECRGLRISTDATSRNVHVLFLSRPRADVQHLVVLIPPNEPYNKR